MEEVYRCSRAKGVAQEFDQHDGGAGNTPPFASEGFDYAKVVIVGANPNRLSSPRTWGQTGPGVLIRTLEDTTEQPAWLPHGLIKMRGVFGRIPIIFVGDIFARRCSQKGGDSLPRKRATPYITTGVMFDPDVLAYLDQLATEDERPRSQVINRIIREHASRNGNPLRRSSQPSKTASA